MNSDFTRGVKRILPSLALLAALVSAACRQDMHDQPRFEPFEANPFYADGRAMRPQIPGTVARGQLQHDSVFLTGRSGEEFVEDIPVTITKERLERGRERFEIFCAPCHGRLGDGQGMIVRRGFPQPDSYHIDRLRSAPAGHFFDVITNGFGAMGDYADRVSPEDRWNIVAYIRALQISQGARLQELPEAARTDILQAVEQ